MCTCTMFHLDKECRSNSLLHQYKGIPHSPSFSKHRCSHAQVHCGCMSWTLFSVSPKHKHKTYVTTERNKNNSDVSVQARNHGATGHPPEISIFWKTCLVAMQKQKQLTLVPPENNTQSFSHSKRSADCGPASVRFGGWQKYSSLQQQRYSTHTWQEIENHALTLKNTTLLLSTKSMLMDFSIAHFKSQHAGMRIML